MTEPEGFMAQLGRALKARTPLSLPNETTVKITVGTIQEMCRSFYAAGYRDGKGANSLFENVFGKDGKRE